MAGKWEGRVKKPPAGREENRLYIVQNAEKKNRLNNDSNDWCTLNSDDTDPHNNVIFYRFVSCLVRDLNIYIYMLDVPNDGKQMNTLSPSPVLRQRKINKKWRLNIDDEGRKKETTTIRAKITKKDFDPTAATEIQGGEQPPWISRNMM
jgi:hypothetical protein